jgi:hypothetical protein
MTRLHCPLETESQMSATLIHWASGVICEWHALDHLRFGAAD